MSDLTAKELRSVRTTRLFLHVRAEGAWEPVTKALHIEEDSTVTYDHWLRDQR